jgi:hypothetical protein
LLPAVQSVKTTVVGKRTASSPGQSLVSVNIAGHNEDCEAVLKGELAQHSRKEGKEK